MALTDQELYGIYPAIFGDLTISHVSNVDAQHGLQQMVITPGGAVDPAAVLEVNRKPMVNLTAHDVGAILTAVSHLTGKTITTAWKVQYQRKVDGGTFVGNGANVLLSGAKGKLLIDSISAQQDQNKPIDVMLKFYALWNGSTVDGNGEPLPIEVTTAQNLTGSPGVGAIYKLGTVFFEGVRLKGVQSTKVNFGVGYNTASADGEKCARIGTIDKRDPSFEIDIRNLTLLGVTGHGHFPIDDGITVYFRRVGYGDSASEHISLNLASGAYQTTPNGTSDEGNVVTKLTATGAGVITVTVGVAIPSS